MKIRCFRAVNLVTYKIYAIKSNMSHLDLFVTCIADDKQYLASLGWINNRGTHTTTLSSRHAARPSMWIIAD